MKIEIEVSDETLRYAVDASHISYWARFVRDVACDAWRVFETESPTEPEGYAWPPDRDSIARGLKVMARVAPEQFGRLLTPFKWDATTGDILIQCALFGEVRYG